MRLNLVINFKIFMLARMVFESLQKNKIIRLSTYLIAM